MKKIIFTMVTFVLLISMSLLFTSCRSRYTAAEDEILGTWKYEEEYNISGVGNFTNRSVYVFKKENGNYVGKYTISSSITSLTTSYDFTYQIVDSKLEITSLETGKIQILDYSVEKDVLKIGDVEYNKVKK